MRRGTVLRAWQENDLQPHRTRSGKFSTVPALEQKVSDVIRLYLHPPERAVVMCVAEKSQIPALDRTQPLLPMRPGQVERRTPDYVRHGTATLFAALDIAHWRGHRHDLRSAPSAGAPPVPAVGGPALPGGHLHLVLDNYRTHKHPEAQAWLEHHPRFHVHLTLASSGWLNQVETCFYLVHRKAIQRGVFRSVDRLKKAIQRVLDAGNEGKHPFVRVKSTAEGLLEPPATRARS